MSEPVVADKVPVAYNIFIVAMFSSYESKLISGLVSKGYTVSATSGDKLSITNSKNGPCSVIAIRVDNAHGIVKENLYDDVSSILEENKMKYYSVIVTRFTYHCMWNAGNISLPKFAPLPSEELNEKNKEDKKKAN